MSKTTKEKMPAAKLTLTVYDEKTQKVYTVNVESSDALEDVKAILEVEVVLKSFNCEHITDMCKRQKFQLQIKCCLFILENYNQTQPH